MTDEILGGRYQLLERVGGGGMAVVYKAQDRLLNRYVAVKVLRQQYVHDEEFIQRFRREAQSAASLSHPNVVSIYDVGQQGEVHYIVMEYVEGTTLNALIKERAPLPVEEAVHIASQICDALDHAHTNGIIHRDIKPHNILIGRNGRVKVTDFGIAKAADSSQLTQTGSVVGSVHYFSPEHAKGVAAGAQSDIYSLGIVMYQMLTGSLPFSGESPISVALKHLQENVEDPRTLNPLIPQSVENIILRSMRKSQEERYRSARQMLDDLEVCLTPERRNEPKLSFSPVYAYDPETGDGDDEQTRIMPAIRGAAEAGERKEQERRPERGESSMPRWMKPILWLVFVVGLLGLLWWGMQTLLDRLTPEERQVPSVIGMLQADAEQAIRDADLIPVIKEEPHKEMEKGRVFDQKPGPMLVNINSTVTLYVSTGTELQEIPDLVGHKLEDVLNVDLPTAGLSKENVKTEDVFSDKPEGVVVEQTPKAGEMYDPEDKSLLIKLKVSKGPEKITMPDLSGRTLDQANVILQQHKLVLPHDAVEEAPSLTVPKGQIWKQEPRAGEQVKPGQSVTLLLVSAGAPADAAQGDIQIQINPLKEGQKSEVTIRYSDAQHESMTEWGKRTIDKPIAVTVPVTVTRDKPAVIEVLLDGNVVSRITKTYSDLTGDRAANAQPADQTNQGSVPPGSPKATPSASPEGAR